MSSKCNHGIQRVLVKLEDSVNSGNYYEAHQMYRTLYFRYLAQKKYADLLELLYNGAILLLQRDQHISGADLGILLVDVLNKSDIDDPQSFFEKITNLFTIMKPGTPERETFVHSALKWSVKHTNYKWGHPNLHKMIAQVLWQEKNYTMARQHFVYSSDGSGCAAMLVELHQERGYSNEVDLFITQIVLHTINDQNTVYEKGDDEGGIYSSAYLCLQNTTTAQEVFDSYTSRHPKIRRGPPYILPLLNFLYFLLKTIKLSSFGAFTALCEQYQISLSRDPSYRTYLDKIAQLYFNVQAPRLRRQGLFGSILQSFFNGLEDDSDPEEQESRQPNDKASTSHVIQELD